MADEDKVERVARALCKASGSDPDGLHLTDGKEFISQHGSLPIERTQRAPNWHLYRDEAHRFVVASEALAGAITSGG